MELNNNLGTTLSYPSMVSIDDIIEDTLEWTEEESENVYVRIAATNKHRQYESTSTSAGLTASGSCSIAAVDTANAVHAEGVRKHEGVTGSKR